MLGHGLDKEHPDFVEWVKSMLEMRIEGVKTQKVPFPPEEPILDKNGRFDIDLIWRMVSSLLILSRDSLFVLLSTIVLLLSSYVCFRLAAR